MPLFEKADVYMPDRRPWIFLNIWRSSPSSILFIYLLQYLDSCWAIPISLEEIKDPLLVDLLMKMGYKEGLPVVWRAIRIALGNTIKQILLILLFLFLNFIPVVGSIISIVLIFIINAYYFGYSFMNYT